MRGGKESLTGLRFGASNLYFFFCLLVSIFLVLMEVKFIIHNFYLTCSFLFAAILQFLQLGEIWIFFTIFFNFLLCLALKFRLSSVVLLDFFSQITYVYVFFYGDLFLCVVFSGWNFFVAESTRCQVGMKSKKWDWIRSIGGYRRSEAVDEIALP
jgi:hypothetical protein